MTTTETLACLGDYYADHGVSVRCKFCGLQIKKNTTRMKNHLMGLTNDVKSCPDITPDIRTHVTGIFGKPVAGWTQYKVREGRTYLRYYLWDGEKRVRCKFCNKEMANNHERMLNHFQESSESTGKTCPRILPSLRQQMNEELNMNDRQELVTRQINKYLMSRPESERSATYRDLAFQDFIQNMVKIPKFSSYTFRHDFNPV